MALRLRNLQTIRPLTDPEQLALLLAEAKMRGTISAPSGHADPPRPDILEAQRRFDEKLERQ
jgi:hypothetical protein